VAAARVIIDSDPHAGNNVLGAPDLLAMLGAKLV